MRRIFTALTALTCMLIFTTASAQTCLTGGSWTPVTTNTFSTTAEGFTGDFTWRNTGNGQLESTPTTDGTLKLLQSATYVFPASETTLAWSFTLSGTAQVTGYTVKARTYENGT
ncbi:MAG TPA: hypothetical protein VFZ78_05810, partial [Flavisolibacter sp.]